MLFFCNLFKNLINKPSLKFRLNLFFLRESINFHYKHILYIYNFTGLTNILKIKIFKENFINFLTFYKFVILFNILFIILFIF